ncbi:TatD family hydrolase [Candidatus Nomurabacteria bacterium]|nr:TatD family hydrolase [Candidatus Nomurabacteria bacterium]
MSGLEIIDIHSHLNFPQYDDDREAVFARANGAGIGMINVGTDLASSRLAVSLAQERDNVWATVGLHPTDHVEGFEREVYLSLAKNEKVVAIGECGLDYFHQKTEEEKRKQQEIFIQQIDLANELKKPLMLHIRNAYREAYEILKTRAEVKGNAHFFAGTWEEARLFLDFGFTLSFGGVITFTRDYDEVIKNTPIEMILTETDCPFVAPIPYRGKRNEPSYLPEIVRKLAEIKGLTYVEVATETLKNAKRVFLPNFN